MILANGDVGIRVQMEPCHRILDRKGMPEDWATSVTIPIFKGKVDIMNCGMHRGVKLLEHAMKIVEKVLWKKLRKRFSDISHAIRLSVIKGTIDAVFILGRIKEEYLAKQKKLYMSSVNLDKASDRVPRKVVEWAKRKKGIP